MSNAGSSTKADWFAAEVFAHHALLARYLRQRGLQQADAADLCQDAYLRILEASAASRPRCGKAFALRVVRNLLIDSRRSARSRWLRLAGNVDDLDRPDPLDPERHVIAEADLSTLSAAVSALPIRRRQVFLMRRVENLSLQQIARSLRITVKSVERNLTQALKTLRGKMSSAGYDETMS